MAHPPPATPDWPANVVVFRRRATALDLAASLWLAGLRLSVLPAHCALAACAAFARG